MLVVCRVLLCKVGAEHVQIHGRRCRLGGHGWLWTDGAVRIRSDRSRRRSLVVVLLLQSHRKRQLLLQCIFVLSFKSHTRTPAPIVIVAEC